jgi:hypothetical protein
MKMNLLPPKLKEAVSQCSFNVFAKKMFNADLINTPGNENDSSPKQVNKTSFLNKKADDSSSSGASEPEDPNSVTTSPLEIAISFQKISLSMSVLLLPFYFSMYILLLLLLFNWLFLRNFFFFLIFFIIF